MPSDNSPSPPLSMDRENLRAHLLATLEGMTVGDALGGPYEFRRRGSYVPETTHYVRNETFGLPPGCFTDDTSMALCLGESLLEGFAKIKREESAAPSEKQDPFDAVDVMRRWHAWYAQGHLSAIEGLCFDIGNQTRGCLEAFASPPSNLTDPYQGRPDSWGAGNGGIMRLAPVPVAYFGWGREKVVRMCREQSVLTHATEACLDAAGLMGVFVYEGLAVASGGGEPEERARRKIALFQPETHAHLGIASSEVRTIVATLPTLASTPKNAVKTSGYVVHTLHAALWAFAVHDSYMGGMKELLGMGDDVDTVCAVYGAIAGAWYGLGGEKGVPEELRRTLDERCRGIADGIWGPLVGQSLTMCT